MSKVEHEFVIFERKLKAAHDRALKENASYPAIVARIENINGTISYMSNTRDELKKIKRNILRDIMNEVTQQ